MQNIYVFAGFLEKHQNRPSTGGQKADAFEWSMTRTPDPEPGPGPRTRHFVVKSIEFIQSASRSPPGQVWDQFFCHFGSLFESIVTPWGHFGRP